MNISSIIYWHRTDKINFLISSFDALNNDLIALSRNKIDSAAWRFAINRRYKRADNVNTIDINMFNPNL